MKKTLSKPRGFTFIELIIIISVFVIIFGGSRVVFGNILGKNSITYHGHQFVQNIREARTNSVTQKNGNSAWGIYLNHASSPDGYTLFEGNSYATRIQSSDLIFEFPEVISVTNVSLGGGDEIVFQESTGRTTNSGSFDLITDTELFSISLNELGLIDYSN